MKKAFVQALCRAAAKDPSLVLVSGDLGFGVLTPFWEQFPNRFINAGISEQNMTALAAGMALEGKNVFTYSIGNFPTLRCLEQVRNDVCYHGANVTIVAVGGGLGYGAMGMTHHATEDIAILRALPGMRVFVPADEAEAVCATGTCAETAGPCYLRLGNAEGRLHHGGVDAIIGTALLLREGRDTAVFAAGPVAAEALAAAETLAAQGVSCAVYSVPSVKPLDEETVLAAARGMKHIYTAEEHNIVGGLGGAVAELLAAHRNVAALGRFGLGDVYTSTVGSTHYLRQVYGIDAAAMAGRIARDMARE